MGKNGAFKINRHAFLFVQIAGIHPLSYQQESSQAQYGHPGIRYMNLVTGDLYKWQEGEKGGESEAS
ncbi:hypothetical protein DC17_12650 [Salmonella enterica subsp. enterica serovar Heidelberg]|nr:hypothetical protein CFSAN002069_14595 [Salmonella enterica subsp. enterica serovar Heidelberg str. CFSAN002069]AHB97677.1 hypothetical protein CFSAN002064_10765 [Salmonella enterica subsp. enterica serovar Heidelberg str. CFSAN002064]EDZ25672.1 hypothetical protein SeHB_A3651 [Salmonella enterica subsp. enterica serovar Heidelberg str. SL486]OLX02689.1 hypothetical protein DB97_00190 [Salmonella enterica subsp. enterica serovar Heidelberg]OLX05067.1 hypothetical protein BD45_15435 [Salmonel